MGYANIFWISERPIRNYIAINSKDDVITAKIGAAILDLTAHDTYRIDSPKNSEELLGESSIFNSVGSFHSTDFVVLVWTGTKLIKFPDLSSSDYRFLVKLDRLAESENYVVPLSAKKRRSIIDLHQRLSDYKHDNPLASSGEISIYWMYEDFSRSYGRMPKDKWPVKEVGNAVLQLMLDVWHSSAQILSHGNPISKVGSFVKSEFAVFVWMKNYLSRLIEIDETTHEEIIEWLDEGQKTRW